MFFDAQAALLKLNSEAEPFATPATPATREGKSGPHVAEVASVATMLRPNSEAAPVAPCRNVAAVAAPAGPDMTKPDLGGQGSPYGTTLGGRVKTWTGKIVNLDEWHRMSEWERHGSTGKMWSGLTRRWEE